MEEPKRPDLNGHKAFEAGICYQCGGGLFDFDGSFSEMMVEGRRTFAARICNGCKDRQGEELRADEMARSGTTTKSQRISPRAGRKAPEVGAPAEGADPGAVPTKERTRARRSGKGSKEGLNSDS